MKNVLTIALLIGAAAFMGCAGDEGDDPSDDSVVAPVAPATVEPQKAIVCPQGCGTPPPPPPPSPPYCWPDDYCHGGLCCI